jgi:hypothetical protein
MNFTKINPFIKKIVQIIILFTIVGAAVYYIPYYMMPKSLREGIPTKVTTHQLGTVKKVIKCISGKNYIGCSFINNEDKEDHLNVAKFKGGYIKSGDVLTVVVKEYDEHTRVFYCLNETNCKFRQYDSKYGSLSPLN